MNSITPVILSGGSGSRLWPVSRLAYPKQLLPLVSDKSMLQETVRRVGPDNGFAAPLIVANEQHRFIIAEQLREINIEPRAIMLEPEGRNTAPASVLAALRALEDNEDAVILVLPSDHVITDEDAFLAAIKTGMGAATQGKLVTFGIVPSTPKTGYGYIKKGAVCEGLGGVFRVDAFVEKPDAEQARGYIDSGDYAWNSGIFLLPAAEFLKEAEAFIPEVLKACRRSIEDRKTDFDFERPEPLAFARSPSISIDNGVMEKTERAAVVPVDMGWSDVGTWSALWALGPVDDHGNTTRGDVQLLDVAGSLVRADGASVAAIGVENLVIVTTKDMVLVADRARVEDVKKIVDELDRQGRDEHLYHTVVHRPWGSFESVDAGARFQVKRLIVKPGAKLSLQMHHHRSEHWVVVQGIAGVTCGDCELTLQENESVYIPAETRHRLENPGDQPLHVIEVQTGSYLGEDDIVRFEDTYGRENET